MNFWKSFDSTLSFEKLTDLNRDSLTYSPAICLHMSAINFKFNRRQLNPTMDFTEHVFWIVGHQFATDIVCLHPLAIRLHCREQNGAIQQSTGEGLTFDETNLIRRLWCESFQAIHMTFNRWRWTNNWRFQQSKRSRFTLDQCLWLKMPILEDWVAVDRSRKIWCSPVRSRYSRGCWRYDYTPILKLLEEIQTHWWQLWRLIILQALCWTHYILCDVDQDQHQCVPWDIEYGDHRAQSNKWADIQAFHQ
jgi:hypothetical protein